MLSLEAQAGNDVDLEPQLSARSMGSAGSGNLGVPIPSGNTRKMAYLFGK